MSDLGTQRYYIAHNPGSQANFTAFTEEENLARLEAAKQHMQKNPVGKVMNDLSGQNTESEDPLAQLKNFLKAILYGIPTVLTLGFLNNLITKGQTAEESKIARAMANLDEKVAQNGFLNRINGYFSGFGNWIKERSIVKHFAGHSKDYEPVLSFARQSSRTLQGEFIGELINKTNDLYNQAGKKPFEEILREAEKRTDIPRWQLYNDAAEQIRGKIVGSTGTAHPGNFSHLRDSVAQGYEKAFNEYQDALKSKDNARIEKAARKFAKKATAVMGEHNAHQVRLFTERFKHMPVTEKARQEMYEELVEHLAKLAGRNLDSATPRNGKLLAELLDDLEGKGFGNLEKLRLKANRVGLIMETQSKSFISKAMKGLYTGANRIVRPGDPFFMLASVYFMGDAIRRTLAAEKGEKFSTFMECMASEFLPYLVMMNALTRLPYEATGGLKTFGKNRSWFLRTLSAPVRWSGNILGMGLDGRLTARMKPEAAEKLFRKAKDPKAALARFNELQARVMEGSAGPKGPISRLMSGDFKFWRGSSESQWKFWRLGESQTYKEMRMLFKENVPSLKRFGIRFKNLFGGVTRLALIVGVLMPLVGGVFTKISHSLFGKPTKTEEEEAGKKAAEQVDQPQQVQTVQETAGNLSPLTKKYLQERKNQPENNRNNPYTQENQSLSSSEIKNSNVPARALNTPQKNYFSIPNPISNNSQTSVEFNKTISEVDRVLKDAELTLYKT